MELILDKLKSVKHRQSTKNNYLSVWRKFNQFIIKLDKRPKYWEDSASLFGAALVHEGFQSSTLRSYMSAIKGILIDDGYPWDDNKLLLGTLAKACKLVNDRVKTRLPIHKGLLELLLFELQRTYSNQPYLEVLYKTIFCLSYYGLFRIGELTTGSHPVKAKDVHIGVNKDKILFVLYSSKTHNLGAHPQEIKITANQNYNSRKTFFCPFALSRTFLSMRGDYIDEKDPFFVFHDQQPVKPSHVRRVLKNAIKTLDLDPNLYNCHSFRTGRASDMLRNSKYSITQVKVAGRWRSNVVFKYIKNFSQNVKE